VFPYVLLSVGKNEAKEMVMGRKEFLDQSQIDRGISAIEEISFKDFSSSAFGNYQGYKLDFVREQNRKELERKIEEFQKEAEGEADEKKLKILRQEIIWRESFDSAEIPFVRLGSPYTSDNVFFFCRTEDYVTGKAL